ncbi:MAG: solute carrier family 26 protein [Haliscomenobacter sp.]|nr:solute carrier family 26 protein [Haliscomenobacter sp.]
MKASTFFPISDWITQYRRQDFRWDAQAGLTVGVMLVPQGMAYGLLAGLPPIYGLYASIVPLFLYAFFGTSRHLSVGPVALVSLLVVTGVSAFAEPGSERFIALAVGTAFLAGLIQILLGIFRLGFMVNFLSHPVMSGFTSAAAFIIGMSQLKYLLGIDLPQSNQIQRIGAGLIQNIGGVHWLTVAIGLAGIGLILFLRRIRKTIPGALITVALGIAVVWGFRLDLQGVDIVGVVPQGLPSFGVPKVSFQDFQQLLPLALTICLISFIESLAIARALETKHNTYKVIPNQELIALGITKMGGAFFQAAPTTGSFTRSAVNDSSGARTGMSSIVASLVVALTLLFLTPFFFYLPKALLASVIVVAVIGLVDYQEAAHLWKTDRRDFYTLLATFIATLTLGIQSGVIIGIILSLALMLYSNSRPHVAVLGRLPNTAHYRNITRFGTAEQQNDLLIFRFDAQLYFGNSSFFQDNIQQLLMNQQGTLKAFVLDCSSISDIDSSGMRVFARLIKDLQDRGVELFLADVIGPVRDKLVIFGLLEKIGEDRLFFSVHEAVEAYNLQKGFTLLAFEQDSRFRKPSAKTKCQ